MKKLLVLLAVALAATSVTAAPAKKPTAKPAATKKAPAKKAVVKKAPPTTDIRPTIAPPPKVARKAVISKNKKK